MKNRNVDVIIPTYRPGKKNLRNCLTRLERQECPPDRIVVMNTGEQYWNREWEKCKLWKYTTWSRRILIMVVQEDGQQSCQMPGLWCL